MTCNLYKFIPITIIFMRYTYKNTVINQLFNFYKY